jgi:hypothetical protein
MLARKKAFDFVSAGDDLKNLASLIRKHNNPCHRISIHSEEFWRNESQVRLTPLLVSYPIPRFLTQESKVSVGLGIGIFSCFRDAIERSDGIQQAWAYQTGLFLDEVSHGGHHREGFLLKGLLTPYFDGRHSNGRN